MKGLFEEKGIKGEIRKGRGRYGKRKKEVRDGERVINLERDRKWKGGEGEMEEGRGREGKRKS